MLPFPAVKLSVNPLFDPNPRPLGQLSFLSKKMLTYLSTMSVLFFFVDSLSWSFKQPTGVHIGLAATLEWTVSLSTEEKSRADRFSLILLEREMFLYSNLWQIMAVKQFSGGVHQEIGNDETFDVIPGSDMTLQLKNITDTDGTRFRCTFLSSFAAPKSIIELEIKGEILLVQMNIRKIIYLNCGETYDIDIDMTDPRSYTHNVSSYEIKA